VLVFDAPVEPGKYELRYLAGPDATTIATRSFDVVAPRVSLAVDGAVFAGQSFAVRWEGPAGRYDEIRLTRSGQVVDAFRAISNTPAQLTAPVDPGTYALVYWAGAAERPLATLSVTVAPAPAP
jgi:Ca-activated chloride channel family protein